MIYLIEMILMGVFATLFMDVLAISLARAKVIHPPIGPEAVGRWTLYMFKGTFVHNDIHKTPALRNEKTAALVSHYLIGIALAGVYLWLEWLMPTIREQLWMPLVFGIATVVLPWFWLYPSMGLGVIASKVSKRSPYITTSLVNHTDFGLGMMIWVVLLRRFIV